MKILHFIHCFPPEHLGGTESYVLNLALRQVRTGHQARVISGSLNQAARQPRALERFQSVEVLRLYKTPEEGPYRILPHYPRLSSEVKIALQSWNPDLVHVHHWHHLTDDICRIAAAERKPVVATLHDFFSVCPRFFRVPPGSTGVCPPRRPLGACFDCIHGELEILPEELERRRAGMAHELESASFVYTFSKTVADFFREIPGFPCLPIHVLPMGLLRPLPMGPPPKAAATLRVVTWGGQVEVKGTHLLLQAASDPLLRGRMVVHIFGKIIEPGYRERLERLAAGCAVRFHGEFPESEKDTFGRRFDLAVFPTLAFETYSIVVDEALALGLPVVTTVPGAQSERIGAGGTSVAAGDVPALARAIAAYMDPDFRKTRRQAAMKVHVGTMDQHWLCLRGIYRDLAGPGRASDAGRHGFPPSP